MSNEIHTRPNNADMMWAPPNFRNKKEMCVSMIYFCSLLSVLFFSLLLLLLLLLLYHFDFGRYGTPFLPLCVSNQVKWQRAGITHSFPSIFLCSRIRSPSLSLPLPLSNLFMDFFYIVRAKKMRVVFVLVFHSPRFGFLLLLQEIQQRTQPTDIRHREYRIFFSQHTITSAYLHSTCMLCVLVSHSRRTRLYDIAKGCI